MSIDELPSIGDAIRDLGRYIGGLFYQYQTEMITHVRVPTPMKVTVNVTADGSGNIGGGLANPSPILLYQCPISQEAWVHRIAVSSPSGQPKAPLTTGQVLGLDGANTMQFFLPVGGAVAPVIMAEGRGSAIHLNSGGRIGIVGDSFTPGTSLRFDLQISFFAGMSEYTPRRQVPEEIGIG